ncbi:head-tail joining protein [Zooshikella ganghwensis]|uniref:Uncharacterized protein n=1 Tax=Zooshikella ganghwensis TaxID=202772 RepID=A0A4P9VER5_9GAMM|nr:hypothetical protein [Zooshikella ganghwensis]RDH41519.1 hypothetical protein B9G39_28295 [Zooshikella ganghwensis]RDH41548.1 hypothetical protein B9G39_27765 [Zooshikella ganghwensis]
MDAFDRATRRLTRRLGDPVRLVDEAGNKFKINAEIIQADEFISKNKNSALKLKLDSPVLQFATVDCPDFNEDWQVEYNYRRYFVAEEPDIEHGLTQVTLVNERKKKNLDWINAPRN